MSEKDCKKKRGAKGNRLRNLLLVFFAMVFLFSGWNLLAEGWEYKVGSDTYGALSQNVITRGEPPRQDTSVPEQTDTSGEPPSEAVEKEPLLDVDFAALHAINDETVAWISSDNGIIDYPVVQGKDNDYYLDHLFDGTQNKSGTIFVDWRNTPYFADRNTFLYGHNMANGSMFASLLKYSWGGYLEEYPELILVTPEESYILQVFSGYVTSADSGSYRWYFLDDEDFLAYIEEVTALSDFPSDVTVTAQDRIVTLSTCAFNYDEARYVLHCKLVPA